MKYLLLLLFCFISSLTNAAENITKTQIVMVGPSFVSNRDASPYFKLLLEDRQFQFEFGQRLKAEITMANSRQNNYDFNSINNNFIQQDDTYIVSFGMVRENVEEATIDDELEISYESQVLVLVANLSKSDERRRIVASYPISLQYRTIVPVGLPKPNPLSVYRSLYLDPKNNMKNIVTEWGSRLDKIKLLEKEVYVTVSPLDFIENAQNSAVIDSIASNYISARATSLFEAAISKNLNIPLIPGNAGASALNRVVLDLVNLNARENFVLPEPDYWLQVSVRDMRVVKASEQTAGGNTRVGESYGVSYVFSIYEKKESSKNLIKKFIFRDIESVYHYGERVIKPSQPLSRMIAKFCDQMGSNIGVVDSDLIAKYKSQQEPLVVSEIAKIIADFSRKLKR